jgi:hypothetical protein
MQHWHVYRKWNERLFSEMYSAFKAGRMDVDPTTFCVLDRCFQIFTISPVPQIPDVCLTIQCRVVKLADAMAWPHASQSTSTLVAGPKRLRARMLRIARITSKNKVLG